MNKTTLKVEAGKQEIFIFREFEAPRDLVFRTLTDPALLARNAGMSTSIPFASKPCRATGPG